MDKNRNLDKMVLQVTYHSHCAYIYTEKKPYIIRNQNRVPLNNCTITLMVSNPQTSHGLQGIGLISHGLFIAYVYGGKSYRKKMSMAASKDTVVSILYMANINQYRY